MGVFYEVLATKPLNPVSWVLRGLLASRWSHAAILDAQAELVYEASMTEGVRCVSAFDWFKEYTRTKTRPMTIEHDRHCDARRWLDSRVGQPYDWDGILGFVVRYFTGRHWHDDGAWHCSELVASFENAFLGPRWAPSVWRITPGHLEMVEL